MPACNVCFHHCNLNEGQGGLCMARHCKDGAVVSSNYGMITAFALDPIEKKPLYHFFPGSRILSVGSYGCNLRCPFCQNYSISYDAGLAAAKEHAVYTPPEQLAQLAMSYVPEGNIGVAYTYNEPLIGYEYVLDTATLVHKAGLQNIVVTNGSVSRDVLCKLLPVIDAMNIDLKGFTDSFYADLLHGDRKTVLDFIETAAGQCHMEVTTLVIPGENGSVEEIDAISSFLAAVGVKNGIDIPLHLTRFFPRYHMTDRDATDVDTLFMLVDVAKRHLTHVHAGNV